MVTKMGGVSKRNDNKSPTTSSSSLSQSSSHCPDRGALLAARGGLYYYASAAAACCCAVVVAAALLQSTTRQQSLSPDNVSSGGSTVAAVAASWRRLLSGLNAFLEPDRNDDDDVDGYKRMYREAERITHDDLSLFTIVESSIHGRGVFITRPVRINEGTFGTVYYEIEVEPTFQTAPTPLAPEGGSEFLHARGYITSGGKLGTEMMSVRDGIERCDRMPKCEGITFRDGGDKLFEDPRDEPTHEVLVEFKDHVRFVADENWQSFLTHLPLYATYFPLGCNANFLVNPPPKRLNAKQMLPCWPRYFNHHCHPNTEIVAVPVPSGFVIPGVPWQRVTYAYRLRPIRDLAAMEEITLNYETLPYYMLCKVKGAECESDNIEV